MELFFKILFMLVFFIGVLIIAKWTIIKSFREAYKLLIDRDYRVTRITNRWLKVNNISIFGLIWRLLFTKLSMKTFYFSSENIMGVILWKRNKKKKLIYFYDIVFDTTAPYQIKYVLGKYINTLLGCIYPGYSGSIETTNIPIITDILEELNFKESFSFKIACEVIDNDDSKIKYVYYAETD